jgi:hypothetical protein
MIQLSNTHYFKLFNETTYFISGGICFILCLLIAIIKGRSQRKKVKLTNEKVESEKGLDDYSYRDLFHFFINPEFHFDKFHLAKGLIFK